jgi:hypothetical protein
MARVGRPGMTEAQKDEVWRCTPIAVVTLLLRSAHISWPPPHHGSISAVGRCADNAAAESFFGVLKRERVNRRQYRTRAEARADLFDYKTPNPGVRGNGVELLSILTASRCLRRLVDFLLPSSVYLTHVLDSIHLDNLPLHLIGNGDDLQFGAMSICICA